MKNNKNRLLVAAFLAFIGGNLIGAAESGGELEKWILAQIEADQMCAQQQGSAAGGLSWLYGAFGALKQRLVGQQEVDLQDLEAGHFEAQGHRPSMEDASVMNIGLYGVCDGHGGKWVATYVKDTIVPEFKKNRRELARTFAALEHGARRVFERKKVAQEDPSFQGKSDYTAGTMAVIAHVRPNNHQIDVAFVGDSRAALIRGDSILAVTRDHRPDEQPELQRLTEAAQASNRTLSDFMTKDRKRVHGLPVSRVLGDFGRKEDLAQIGVQNALIAVPETDSWDYQPGDVLLLACDGVWDVIGNAVNEHGKGIAELVAENRGKSAQEIADFVGQEALKRGTRDNVSVVVKLLR